MRLRYNNLNRRSTVSVKKIRRHAVHKSCFSSFEVNAQVVAKCLRHSRNLMRLQHSTVCTFPSVFSVQREDCPTTSNFRRLQEDNKPDPWAMTDADIAVYNKAFVKLDKDKDGFISLSGRFL